MLMLIWILEFSNVIFTISAWYRSISGNFVGLVALAKMLLFLHYFILLIELHLVHVSSMLFTCAGDMSSVVFCLLYNYIIKHAWQLALHTAMHVL